MSINSDALPIIAVEWAGESCRQRFEGVITTIQHSDNTVYQYLRKTKASDPSGPALDWVTASGPNDSQNVLVGQIFGF
jgi:hypothetical protein